MNDIYTCSIQYVSIHSGEKHIILEWLVYIFQEIKKFFFLLWLIYIFQEIKKIFFLLLIYLFLK